MRRFFFTILFMAGLAPAVAAQAPVKTDPADAINPAKLTINDCLLILSALNALDSHQVVLNSGKAGEQLVTVPYEFAKGGLRLDIAHNIAVLVGVQRESQAAQQKIFYEVLKAVPETKPGEAAMEIKPGTPQSVEYDRQLRELTAKPCGAPLTRINAEDLNLTKNQIPVGVLSNLDKILDR
jgi:hypothetical protein